MKTLSYAGPQARHFFRLAQIKFFGDWSKSFLTAQGVLLAGKKSGNRWTRETVGVSNRPSFNDFVLCFGQDNQGNVYGMGIRARGPNGEQDKIYKSSVIAMP